MKRAWREECHTYLVNNPGQVITRYQFSVLFGQTWHKAMTPHNIMKGFEVTGIYPVDRFKVLPKCSPKPLAMSERTGLKFIPLFTPLRTSLSTSDRIPLPGDDSFQSTEFNYNPDHTLLSLPPSWESSPCSLDMSFTDEELIKFQRRKEERYDIKTDKRYNHWLSLESKENAVVKVPPVQTTIARILATSMPPSIKYPNMQPKSSARVLTNDECRKAIAAKHAKKLKDLKQKELRKQERERKKEEKAKLKEALPILCF